MESTGKKVIKILITGIGRRVELLQAFREAALDLGVELKLYGADMTATAPALFFCDYVRCTVPMKDPSYIDNLLHICKTDGIDLVIPTMDTELLVLGENRGKFENIGTRVLISSPDMIHICRDKNLTSGFFEGCGLHAPMPVNDWRNYKSGYPAIIKPKDGSGSINAFRVENVEELEMYAGKVTDYIIQPYITGREYTIDIFCDWCGNPVSIVPRERLQVRAGEVLMTRIDMDETMIEESRKLCATFKPCGPMTVQVIRDDYGTDWFIEINPRFGGGAPLSMKAGARSAETILRLLRGERPGYIQDVSDHVVYCRFDESICITEAKSRIRGVIFDLDDTLYPEKDYVRSGFKTVSDALGGGYEEQLMSYFEAGKPAIDELLRGLARESEKDILLKVYREHQPDIHLYDGVQELIERLKSRGIRVGIITDGRPEGQRGKIEALGLGRMVDDIIVTDELGGPQFRKPCDIAFRIIQTRWKISAGEIVYVGDNALKDFAAPRQLGMKSIYFQNSDGLYKKCDAPFKDIVEIDSILELERYI
ncbi:MAG: ATP-grasp domain-containing protein [Lachnospiraceae bacterium]|nr:ATP-grasp domain-containing protein [Lachnospiraceae bacterium]